MQEELKLTIEGMHCGACVRRVTNALEGVSGLKLEAVNVGSAQVRFNPEVATPKQIAEAVNRIGFQARVEK
ncbi:copper chaperone CopZ [Silvibacterium bohemicum]|uniref:Copper chaperone CopZ n=1 Tax=Silvibacterium bohemicum TaxID=1577686 RepID=A0A841JR93_9BACT|nr:heavy metal-associated domain-containing protein [Silvibacterium bohemicum]MBB6142935.1 copper chaperone CopZ [Silvibacterium bohemicum]